MTLLQYTREQLVLSRQLLENYEEEACEADVLELERKRIMKRLQGNLAKYDELKLKMEECRRGIREKQEELREAFEGRREGGAA